MSGAERTRRFPMLWLLIGVVTTLLGFAAVFEIDQAVRATGQVIPGLRTQIIQVVDGGVLTADELAMNEALFATGDVARSEVLRLERQVLDLKARIAATRNKYLTDTRQELARLEEELSSSRYKLEERASILAHTDLLSPTDGLVKYIRVSTVGGVLKPGDELMQISPVDDELLVELKINPADIGQLATGMPVALRFDAFDSSLFGKVEGSLRYISPDTLSEQGPDGNALVYYRGQVRIDWSKTVRGTAQTLREDEVKPGMTVTADVLVGKRTILYYLLKPVMRGFSGAMMER